MAALRESRRNLLGLQAAQKALEEAIKREEMQACAHEIGGSIFRVWGGGPGGGPGGGEVIRHAALNLGFLAFRV